MPPPEMRKGAEPFVRAKVRAMGSPQSPTQEADHKT
jgi:hypothetical protein